MSNILNNLGLCMRSGNLVIGESPVVDALKNGTVCYIFLANDASTNTKKKITDKAKFYNVEVCLDYNSFELSQAIGKENRKVLGLKRTGSNFLKILRK